MKNDLKEAKYKKSIYTDLAIESKEVVEEHFPDDEIDGVVVEDEFFEDCDIKATCVKIINKHGEKLLGKPIGNYITIEADNINTGTSNEHNKLTEILVSYIKKLGNLEQVNNVLVVGLGNDSVSADSLGPKVANKILVTRHFINDVEKDLANKIKIVSSITPGVMGQTGIETLETIKGVAKKVKPDLIIAVDALAARKTSRINSTIQLSDAGIIPGSGVNNKRSGLNFETLAIPVIAVGVPTVISATTMVNDTIDMILEKLCLKEDVLSNMTFENKFDLIEDVLSPNADKLFVTPKEVNSSIKRWTTIISNSINLAVHHGLNLTEISNIMY